MEAVGCKRTRPDEGDGDDGWDNGSTAPPPAPPPSPAPAASVAAEVRRNEPNGALIPNPLFTPKP